jgi:uncharacterized protein
MGGIAMKKSKDKVDWHETCSRAEYDILLEQDVFVPMRDGVRLAADIYRPKAKGKFPALLSFSWYGKESQKLPTNPNYQPSDYMRGTGGHECGEQSYYVPRGYVQVIPDIRGVGNSEGEFTVFWGKDGYDVVEWIAAQPWCNGNVGMIGMSAFAIAQFMVAAEKPPHLKAIFPFEGLTDWYRQNYYQGGIFNYYFPLHLGGLMPIRTKAQASSLKEFSEEELNRMIKELQRNPDIMCTPFLYMITTCPQSNPTEFDLMMHPYDGKYYSQISAHSKYKDIGIPSYLGTRWNGWVLHQPGAFDAYEKLAGPIKNRKLLVVPSDNYGGMDRPLHEIQDVCLRWYDYWLKGTDTGIMNEPPITLFVQGINKWRYENEWPLEATQWTKYYLRENGRLSLDGPSNKEEPQTFTSDPWADPSQGFRRADVLAKAGAVPKVMYETEPLQENIEVTGPIALYWHAAIESKGIRARTVLAAEPQILEPITNDTDWYLKLFDVDVDGSDRCVAEGWLKASHYELDDKKSEAYAPYHPHTRNLPIPTGKTILYASSMNMTSNVFLMGHKIKLEISGQDQVQALWYHLPHMANVKHTIFSSKQQPSYILLPVIPKNHIGAGEPQYPPAGPFRIPKNRRAC